MQAHTLLPFSCDGRWWVSNILTNISHFSTRTIVISSNFMYFDEFCECTGDLSISTEIEVRKHTKRSNLEQRINKKKDRDHRRSIGKNFKDQKQSGRTIVDQSRNTRRSIGRSLRRTTARSLIDRSMRANRSVVQLWSRLSHRRSIARINWSIGKTSWCKTALFSRLLRLQILSKNRSKYVLYK